MKITGKKSKNRSRRLEKVGKRLAAYSAAAAATAMTGGTANAAEVIYDIDDVPIWSWGLDVNVVTGGVTPNYDALGPSAEGSFRVGSGFFWGWMDIAGPAGDAAVGFPGYLTASTGGYSFWYASLLNVGQLIGTAGQSFGAQTYYNSTAGNYTGVFEFSAYDPQNTGIVGLKFTITGDGGPATHYGWAEITGYKEAVSDDPINFPGEIVGYGALLHGFGYNDVAGEPSVAASEGTTRNWADFDADYDIDGDDFLIWQAGFGVDDRGDANGDGVTDGDDFLTWQAQFGTTIPSPPEGSLGSAVPEPSSILLLAGGAAGLGMWRRRRTD